MRFHCGISFSWRSIKKFLFPILIGLLAFFGFNFIYDNNTPLGFLKVKALENYETRYDIDYDSVSTYVNRNVGQSDFTLSDMLSTIQANTITREFTMSVRYYLGSLYYVNFYIFDSSSNYYLSLFGKNQSSDHYFKYIFTGNNNLYGYQFNVGSYTSLSDFTSSANYTKLITCLSGGACDTFSDFQIEQILFKSPTTIDNTSNNDLSFSSGYFFYYSSKDLIINNTYYPNVDGFFYKSIYIDNESIDVGSKFPTYLDYINPTPEPEPEPTPVPDVPTEDTTEHKALFNKIYWFDDNSTEYGVLTSIYELLFLYCLTMIIFRILTYIKNTRW